jgi:hypothetical protein
MHELRAVASRWQRSRELTAALRARGLRAPREAFVVDWDRVLTDDPKLVAFYDFGFWNSLHPGFRAERPSPLAHAGDPARFASFLSARGVRFIVLSKTWPHPAALRPVALGQGALPGFDRVADLAEDVVFARQQ